MIGAGLAAGIVGAGILGLRATIRIGALHPEHEQALKDKGVPFVYTLWHGRMVLCILAHLHEGIVTMASRSKDGEIIARWLLRNGYIPTRGSTRKGGRAALEEMGHPADERAERLAPDEFVELARPGRIESVREALTELGQPADARAEALSPQEFLALSAKLGG